MCCSDEMLEKAVAGGGTGGTTGGTGVVVV